jgi:hypothetical protein
LSIFFGNTSRQRLPIVYGVRLKRTQRHVGQYVPPEWSPMRK